MINLVQQPSIQILSDINAFAVNNHLFSINTVKQYLDKTETPKKGQHKVLRD